ncbi:unnamed protein product, partial [Sphacelaria rigidula]
MRAAHHVARVSCLAAVIAASSYRVARGSIEVPRRMTPPKPNSVQRSKPSGECGQDRGIVGEGAWDDGLLERSSSGGTGGLGSVVQEVIADRGRGGGGGVGVAPTDAISSAHHKARQASTEDGGVATAGPLPPSHTPPTPAMPTSDQHNRWVQAPRSSGVKAKTGGERDGNDGGLRMGAMGNDSMEAAAERVAAGVSRAAIGKTRRKKASSSAAAAVEQLEQVGTFFEQKRTSPEVSENDVGRSLGDDLEDVFGGGTGAGVDVDG